MNCSYNEQWDRALQESVHEGPIVRISEYKVIVGVMEIWVGNHPYGFATPYRGIDVRPSRRTIEMFTEKLLEHDINSRTKMPAS